MEFFGAVLSGMDVSQKYHLEGNNFFVHSKSNILVLIPSKKEEGKKLKWTFFELLWMQRQLGYKFSAVPQPCSPESVQPNSRVATPHFAPGQQTTHVKFQTSSPAAGHATNGQLPDTGSRKKCCQQNVGAMLPDSGGICAVVRSRSWRRTLVELGRWGAAPAATTPGIFFPQSLEPSPSILFHGNNGNGQLARLGQRNSWAQVYA